MMAKIILGLFTVNELIAKIATYPNPLEILIWRLGFEGWRRSGDLPELANLLLGPPPLSSLTVHPENRIGGFSEAKDRSRYNDFIAKNWRGEYPLWVTYWIFNFLGSVILFVVASVALENFICKCGL